MKHAPKLLLVVGLIAAGGCSDNPVNHDDHDSEFFAEISVSGEHISTLSETDFDITLRTDDGSSVTGIEAVQIEFRLEDAEHDEWEVADLIAHGSHYETTHTFMSSGDYLWRIVVDDHNDGHASVLHESDEHLEVERAHENVGDYRVEFESFPGHIQEGMTATVSFWVFESDDDHGETGHDGVTGLETVIKCNEPDDHMEEHAGHEREPGIYSAEHLFEESGEAQLSIRFHGHDGTDLVTIFHVPVDPTH